MHTLTAEGVIRFTYELQSGPAPSDVEIGELSRWRKELYDRDSIGGDISRYGAFYGNVSLRTGGADEDVGYRQFIVSCTQTGDNPNPKSSCYCRILRYDHHNNRVLAIGPCAPSSEALTHAAMYDASHDIRAIVHGHDSILWQWLQQQNAPATPPHIDYGTVAMAHAARDVVSRTQASPFRYPGILSMDGHLDGVIAWGDGPAQATKRYLAAWTASRMG